jgi:hypothetical protein
MVFITIFSSCVKEKSQMPEQEPMPLEENLYTVSYEEALNILESALNDLDSPATRGTREARKIANHYTVGEPLGNTITRSANGENPDPYVHIFNFEDEKGYALISGDTRTAPIFAITESGSIEENSEVSNPGLIVFLANMESLYFDSIDNYEETPSTRATSTSYGPWNTSVYGTTSGLSFNDWNQSPSPYNDLLPTIDGQRAPAGCVATATAILMAFHKHPSYCDGYVYLWDQMVKHRPSGSFTTYSPAYAYIARLFQQIGLPKNLDMSYGASSSGGWEDNIPRTLKNFGYSNGGSLSDYNDDKVFNELKLGYAAIVSGYAKETVTKKKFLGITVKTTITYSEGHVWVLDRVLQKYRTKTEYTNGVITLISTESQYLVHCNFGWGGYDNGYYYSRAFNTNVGPSYTRSGTSGHYQYDIDAITGIRK